MNLSIQSYKFIIKICNIVGVNVHHQGVKEYLLFHYFIIENVGSHAYLLVNKYSLVVVHFELQRSASFW